MSDLETRLRKEVFPFVEKPTRYIGNEQNVPAIDPDRASLEVVLAYPDVYEIGMSHLGLKILYHLLNAREDFLCERTFAPWVDMEETMHKRGIPLFSLETFRPVRSFDIFGFTLQYEMTFTGVLNMLDLAGLELRSSDRTERDPLVIAGGPCASNPEPLAPFIDLFVIGEGEEVVLELAELCAAEKEKGTKRRKLLTHLARIPGIYVPSLYEVDYGQGGRIAGIHSQEESCDHVQKRVVPDLNRAFFPTEMLVPYMDIVHERIPIEVARGCTHGCRFCQAGTIYRPVRERSTSVLFEIAQKAYLSTGFEEISLVSLSTGDHSQIGELVQTMVDGFSDREVSISLPSLRLDTFSLGLAEQIREVKKPGLTFAPEAGTQRLRNVINKGIEEKDLIATARQAFSSGWRRVKLYFMIGLPTETEEDLAGIVRLAKEVLALGRSIRREQSGDKKGRPVQVTVSASVFIPKPHSVFQWAPQISLSEMKERQEYLKENLQGRGLEFDWHDPHMSRVEAVIARGDRRVGRLLVSAWQDGSRLSGWSEHFDPGRWEQAFEKSGIDPVFYAERRREKDEIFPWSVIDMGLEREFLYSEYERAHRAETTTDCRTAACSECGVCPSLGVSPVLEGDVNGQD